MRKMLSILEEKGIQQGIIVFPGNMTPSARKVIVAMASQFRLEEFSESDLLVNITHHSLVPRHQVLSPSEKKVLLEKYRLKETQLPRIQLADPVARYYGLRRGQVVKITRPSETIEPSDIQIFSTLSTSSCLETHRADARTSASIFGTGGCRLS
ncbi:RPB5 subunit of DNA-directed RNA polymerase [Lentinula edodes]|uniref:RPB5 subunit of DNA-directed RNA polymerase n=1 Tax=Lentinula edodes TaxID=5353 RepID=A0A1Q3EKY4_LENED|nr:RPB5 subunit of DNA-directed RNA polymerase [Lentinula edodes]